MVPTARNINLLAFLIHLGWSIGLRDVAILVPKAIMKGDTAILKCMYDLEEDLLYQVKWYKGHNEFFRYTPREDPPFKMFPLDGLKVEVKNSSQHELVLPKVQLDDSGHYGCEVSADAPSFYTDLVYATMTVVETPSKGPFITGLRTKYRVGDLLQANCTTVNSKPAALLTWTINGSPVHKHNITYYPTYSQKLETSVIGLRFHVHPKHFVNGNMKIRCRAEIMNIYWRIEEKSIDSEKQRVLHIDATPPPPQSARNDDPSNPQDQTRTRNSSANASLHELCSLVLAFLFSVR